MSSQVYIEAVLEKLQRVEFMLIALTEKAMNEEIYAARKRASEIHRETMGSQEIHDQIREDMENDIKKIKARWGR